MPRFAILRHDSPSGLHWDLLLETGEVLRTWALPEMPQRGAAFLCRLLPDHRLLYLDYEGPVSDGRGTVRRWDHGQYRIESQRDGELVVVLEGGYFQAMAVFRERGDGTGCWEVVFSEIL